MGIVRKSWNISKSIINSKKTNFRKAFQQRSQICEEYASMRIARLHRRSCFFNSTVDSLSASSLKFRKDLAKGLYFKWLPKKTLLVSKPPLANLAKGRNLRGSPSKNKTLNLSTSPQSSNILPVLPNNNHNHSKSSPQMLRLKPINQRQQETQSNEC